MAGRHPVHGPVVAGEAGGVGEAPPDGDVGDGVVGGVGGDQVVMCSVQPYTAQVRIGVEFRCCWNASCTARTVTKQAAAMSAGPPAAKGTMIVTVRAG